MAYDSEAESEALPKEPAEPSLRRQAAGGAAWQGLSYFSGKVLVLISTAILARLLSVEEFGLVGFALVFIVFAEVLTDLGVAQAVIYFPADDRRNDAAVALSLVSSVVLVIVAVILAPAVASVFDEPEVTNLFRVLALSLFCAALGQVPDALIKKELRFKNKLITELCRSGGQGVVSVALALAGAGAWSIVLGYLAGNLLKSAASWILVSYRPSRNIFRFDGGTAGPLLRYGVVAAGNGLLLSFVFNVDYLIVGSALGERALAFYTLAFRLPQMAIINVFQVLSSVAFPMFSRTQDDPARLQRGYLTSLRVQTLYGVGAGVALAVAAPLVVEVVFGTPKWTPAIVPLQALALYASFRSLGIGAIDLYRGTGRPGLGLASSVVRLAVLLPALIVATHWGIETVSWVQAGVALVLALGMQVVATRLIELPLRSLAGALWPSLVVGCAVAVGAGAARLWMPGPALGRLIAAGVFAALCGFGALWVADRTLIEELREMTRRRPAARPG